MTTNRLKELENKNQELTSKIIELQESHNEANDKIEAIIKLIDIRITENQQLAYLHFPEPEDEYINEYDSRADELAKLKDLILNG
jgi:predicted transcriptional regulator